MTKGQSVGDADVWFGKEKTVPLVAGGDVVLTLPMAGQNETTFTLRYTGPVPAPINAGDHIADLVVKAPQQEPQTIPLYAGATVEKLSAFGRIFATLGYYLHGHKE